MDEIKISLDEVKKDFELFLNMDRNARIFFSGQFGIGKTYFLKDFFEVNSDNYDVYHLFPVNYQIHSNDDVIELLKYDLLVELSKKDKDIFQTNTVSGIKESSLLFYSWIKENYSANKMILSTISLGEFLSDLAFDPISSFLGKLGRPLKSLLEIDRNFQEFKKEYMVGEKGLVEKYEEVIRTKNTSETDYISSLVKEKITQNKKSKKSILVLDDMDRIDPEHIFRILNILSAHFERGYENKFGFDSIIIVADYSNLRYIFQHRYGPKTDFSGYIDKFFTIYPYYFDNKKAISARVNEIVKRIRNEEPNINGAMTDSGYIKLFLVYIFTNALDNKIISLRQLLKATSFLLPDLRKGTYEENHFTDNFQKIFNKAVNIAIHSFSNTGGFVEKIEIFKNKNSKARNTRMPFDRYISVMLKSLGTILPENEPFNISWGKYHLTKNENGFKLFDVKDNKEEALFCDLLIQYIEGGHHESEQT